MIGNYVMVVTPDSSFALDKTYIEIETAIRQGIIVMIAGGSKTLAACSFVISAERDDTGHFTITDSEKHTYQAESLDGYPKPYHIKHIKEV